MVWISNREGSDRCYMFFGDRVMASDFAVSEQRQGRRPVDLKVGDVPSDGVPPEQGHHVKVAPGFQD